MKIKDETNNVGAGPVSAPKGITLIALVITIIVLLILAGITISLTLGEHGILNVAKQAGVKTQEESAKEKLELVLMDLQAKKQIDETYNDTTYLDAEINKNGMTISEDIVTVNGFQFEIDRSELKIKNKVEEIIDTSIPYEGVGYKFIYDGSLNESGNTGANMCNELTGGWTEKRTTYTWNGTTDKYYRGWLYTNNTINLSDYDKLYAKSNVAGAEYFSYIYGSQIQYLPNNIEGDFEDMSLFKNETITGITIPENWQGYIGIFSLHSSVNTWYYDYAQNYVRNYTESTRYIDVYEIIAMKEDDWKKWLKIAKISEAQENCNTLEEVLNNQEVLRQLFNNKEANEYLLKCSGTLMIELLKEDEAFNQVPNILKEKMKDNVNWNKFAIICGRTL